MSGSAIVLDTETTSLVDPQVIQLAFSGPSETPFHIATVHVEFFRPTKPISLGAMATHHILPSEVAHCDPWPGEWAPPAGIAYIAAHNVDFDWKAIGSPDVKRICTLALARHVWPELDSHSLGAIIYSLLDHREAKDLLKSAHDAAADVHLCEIVLARIIDATGAKTWPDLWALSERARVPAVFHFGKFQGRRISEIRREDPGYISWCLRQQFVLDDPYLQKALRGESA